MSFGICLKIETGVGEKGVKVPSLSFIVSFLHKMPFHIIQLISP